MVELRQYAPGAAAALGVAGAHFAAHYTAGQRQALSPAAVGTAGWTVLGTTASAFYANEARTGRMSTRDAGLGIAAALGTAGALIYADRSGMMPEDTFPQLGPQPF